ncbi:hypothetical protein ATY78_22280 [Rhizobium sp. R635]|nr:hypothetical protein ATY78_22280 [Rhizobium sp. R635]
MAQGQGETISYTPAIVAALCPLWQSSFDQRERRITIPCIGLIFVRSLEVKILPRAEPACARGTPALPMNHDLRP